MDAPNISVIVPMYNAESTIEKLLDSIMEQTLNDIELILIDDCSTDNTVQVVEKKLADQKLKNHIIKNKTNQGQSLSRRLGLSKASGRFISFIDADDWLEATMYEEMYETAHINDADIVTCNHYVEWENDVTIESNYKNDLIAGILTNEIAGSLWNKIIKKDLLDESIFWPKLNMGEDGAICIQTILKAKSIIHIDKPLYHYYINPSSTINKKGNEDYLTRSVGLKESSDIIFEVLNRYKCSSRYLDSILYRKVYINTIASPIANNRHIYNRIIKLYPEISVSKVISSRLPNLLKIRYILFRTRLYPYLHKIYTLFRFTKLI